MIQYIFFQIDPRSNLDELHSLIRQLKHRSFRYKENRLSMSRCKLPVEGNLPDHVNELFHSSFALDPDQAVLHFYDKPACGKGGTKYDLFSGLGDIDKPPHPGERCPNLLTFTFPSRSISPAPIKVISTPHPL